MSLGGILLGLVNVAIVAAILVLIGLVAIWIFNWLGFQVPAQVQKVYIIIVSLICLYMLIALLLGIGPTISILR